MSNNPLRDKASALNVQGRHNDALALYDRLIASAPDNPTWQTERAAVLRNLGRDIEAIEGCHRALALNPSLAEGHFLLAGLLLRDGRYRDGFREYEWRLQMPDVSIPARQLRAPFWDGQPAPDKRLMVVAEQGLGDTVQFVRFIAKARERVGALALVVQEPLRDLCASAAGADTVLASGDALPAHDLKVSLLSLPYLLRTSLATLPAPTGYLSVDGASSRAGEGLNVGLNWQGNPSGAGDRGRSVSLDTLAPLLDMPGSTYVSLQRDHGLEQLSEFPGIIDAASTSKSFADTARIMESLDLIITTDTAVAHVAGALGRPTWVLLKHAATWRWLKERSDSPWYPTMRLYRQSQPGEWADVVDRVTRDLTALLSNPQSRI